MNVVDAVMERKKKKGSPEPSPGPIKEIVDSMQEPILPSNFRFLLGYGFRCYGCVCSQEFEKKTKI